MAGPFSGFINKVKDAAGGVESMASSIGSSFGDAVSTTSAAGRWAATPFTPKGGVLAGLKREKNTISDTYNTPLAPFGLIPSPHEIANSVGNAVKNPTPKNVGGALLDTSSLLVGEGEAGRAAVGAGLRGIKGADLASESGKFVPGFQRSAEEVFAANRSRATAGKLADIAGETKGAAGRAVATAKQLVSPDTGLVMSKVERAGSGLVREATAAPVEVAVNAENATNAGAAAASKAASAAKATAKEAMPEAAPSAPSTAGRFTKYVTGKAGSAGRGLITSPVEAVKEFGKAGGDLVQAVTHPGLLRTPVGVAKAALHGGEGVAKAIPAAAAAAGTVAVVQAHNRPAFGDAADGEYAKNMNMSVEDYRGIKAVAEKKGDAGLAALTSGLAKAKASGYLVEHAAGRTGSAGSKLVAKKKAQQILKSSVQSAADAQINVASFGK